MGTEAGRPERRLEQMVGAPRVRTVQKDRNGGLYRYRQHDIELSRENRGDDWYITVRCDDGCYLYDGWWRDSAGKPQREAVLEAIRGACLRSNDPAQAASRGSGESSLQRLVGQED